MSKCNGGARIRREVLNGLVIAAVLTTAGCRPRTRYPDDLPDSPQAALEQQLLDRRDARASRTDDGGLLYATEFSAGNAGSLRVPYDLLKLECENHGGRFEPSEPPKKTAVSLASDDTPPPVRAVLQDADARSLFGTYRCDAGEDSWFAELEPTELSPGRRADSARIQLYAKATWADDDGSAGPAGPGLPAVGQGVGELPASEGPALQPGAQPGAADRKPVSPLDPQPSRPAASGDRLLADPRPFGLEPGSDNPSNVAQKLRIELSKATPCNSPNLTGLCWDHPGAEAESLRAGFTELKDGPVLAELEVRYPASSHAWLTRMFDNALGPSDVPGGPDAPRSWSWLHTIIELSRTGAVTELHVTHKPSLDRAQLPKNTPGREPLRPSPLANPWQLQLGFEPAQAAQTKLQQAGFSVPGSGCSDGPSEARPIFVRTCPLRAGSMPHVRGAWVRTVDIGDGRARLAELGYQLEDATWKDSLRDLKGQYGEPIPSSGGALQWWTGPVGITLTPSGKGNAATLRYYHGRLLQYFIVAESKAGASKPGEKQTPPPGM